MQRAWRATQCRLGLKPPHRMCQVLERQLPCAARLEGAQAGVVDDVRGAVVPAVLAHMLRIHRVPRALWPAPARVAQLAERRARQVRDAARNGVKVGAVEVQAQQQAVCRAPAARQAC